MTKEKLSAIKLPESSGVYFFIGAKREILYIGKATSLRQRVQSYFLNNLKETRSELILQMVTEAKTLEFTTTDSVLEALLLETNLIRTHKPHFNTKSKDDKSYNHIIITNDDWPRILVVRGKDLGEKYPVDSISSTFGPFPNSDLLRQALKIVRKLFKFYDTPHPVEVAKSKIARGQIDFNRQIGLYPKNGDRQSYLETVHQVKLFFEGKKTELIKELEQAMFKSAGKEEFEQAAIFKRRIFALKHIEDISLIKDESKQHKDGSNLRVEAYDIAHHGGASMVGVMVVIEGGQRRPAEYKKFIVKNLTTANDPGALAEIIARRLKHREWGLPQLIVVDGNSIQKRAAEKIIKEHGLTIPVAAVVKDERHKASRIIAAKSILVKLTDDIYLANAESHRFAIGFHRQQRRREALL